MESDVSERFEKMEDRLATVETNVAVIRERYATNDALAALRAEMIERFEKVDAQLADLRCEIAKMNTKFEMALQVLRHELREEFHSEISGLKAFFLKTLLLNNIAVFGLVIAARHRLPLEVFEIGASAGLNLGFDCYRYAFGAAHWGDPSSPVRIAPIFEYIWPSGVGPRVAEPALLLIDPYPWSAPLEEVRLKPK